MSPVVEQVIVVVGGTRGIGEAIAADLALRGATLVVAGRDEVAAHRVAHAIEAEGGRAVGVGCDVTRQADCDRLIEIATTTFGRLDTLFANQGVGGVGRPMIEWSEAESTSCLDVNLLGCLNLARASHAALAADGGGRLIVTGSGTGHNNTHNSGMYGISKAAVSHLVRQLALEWRRDDIAVNELIPGPVRTEMTGWSDEGTAERQDDFSRFAAQRREWLKDPVDVTPLARLIAEFPANGPSGQVFCLNGRLL
ncbi:MAG: SDR family oxidoreductase [Acidimicrobiales bacterium]